MPVLKKLIKLKYVFLSYGVIIASLIPLIVSGPRIFKTKSPAKTYAENHGQLCFARETA